MPNTTESTTKPVHFLDSITEETVSTSKEVNNKPTAKVKTEDVVEDEEEQLLEEDQEEQEENEDLEESDNNEEDQEEQEQQEEDVVEDTEFTFDPFIQELVNSDLLVIPEGKEYDDNINGFKELIDDNVILKHEEFKSKLINPTSAKFLEFLEAGGNPDEYIQKSSEIPDYANMDLEDTNTLKNLIADHLHIQGYEKEDIEAQLAEYEEIGSLAKHATTAQKYLVKHAEKELANITKQQQLAEAERIKALQKEEEEARDYIYNKKIRGFKLTKTEGDKLYDYIFKPVKKEDGKILTQNLLEDDIETKLAIALFKMRKFSFDDIENKAESKVASKLQQQLRKKSDKLVGKNNSVGEEKQTVGLQGFEWLTNGSRQQ